MEEIIEPISKELLKAELTEDKPVAHGRIKVIIHIYITYFTRFSQM